MLRFRFPKKGLTFGLGFALIATLLLSVGTARRAEALSPVNPATLPAAASDKMITEVRGGGFRGGGGFHGGGFRGGGFHGGGFHRGGAHFGGFRGGFHRGGFRHGGYRFATHRFYRHRHVYYGGYYRHHHRCRIVWTSWGLRRVCWHRRWYW